MALGYLGSDIGSDGGDMELRGRQYFDNLAMRSLFQDFEKDKNDGELIKSFKLHDIVHDFAQYLRKNGVEVGTKKKTSCQVCSPQLVSQVKEYRSCLNWNVDSPVCGCLGSLRVLDLQLGGIPQGTEKLIHLRWLNLNYNSYFSIFEGLKTICSELYNLQTLLLRYCKLQEIPREIGNLINLRHLNLSKNASLKELPREIGNLINLRHLDLSWNESLELPREIGNLINLRHLDLSFNGSLKELPREIGNLINLRYLNLSDNESLKELPREIGNLINLRHLNLSWNPSLKELPREIGNLINLRHLDLINTSPSVEESLESIIELSERNIASVL
ncbi:receptor-like protein 12 [Phtheirospermum japonicum]|uniref:Receptor-like protein 12 n=1 Tax=Phtheirospermum japonicum TaxID=374723 RepID=A0A830C648_9LAMI|nr:receptor-like protein 12 [Phtheirospermum japonicum]